ncbi:aldo/keto reductase [Anaerosporobacter faecicola]|uniref:aldo/keto reductase n=1 Tax=Anaerosporobacter faecicola TaxID=2718714 RepID=UPI00143886F3|nr:aldo/keto reductase [Anaerosporobacter faecicola]
MVDLCLGTVQFGMKYGINNTLGQPSIENSFEMLDIAVEHNIKKIDTAFAYGTAENILGEFIKKRQLKNKLEIISKLKPNILEENSNKKPLDIITHELEQSLSRLNIDILDGYLLHTPSYVHNDYVLEALQKSKDKGLTKNIGVSIYEIEDGFSAVDSGVVDYIQLPYSILDQRGEKTQFMQYAKNKGVTIFTRSAFLQGLITMDIEKIPDNLSSAKELINRFRGILDKYDLSVVDGALQYVQSNSNIDYLVFGVDTKEQLLQNINYFNRGSLNDEFITEISNSFNNVEKAIIFPSLWSRK